MRSRNFVALGLGCLALAGLVALVPFQGADDGAVAPHDAVAGSDVVFAGTLVDVTSLTATGGAHWKEMVAYLDNATYLLSGGDPNVTVLVTLPEEATGDVVVHGTVVMRLADDGTGRPLVLVRGHA